MSRRPDRRGRDRRAAGAGSGRRGSPETVPSVTNMLTFSAREPFSFNQHNCRDAARQDGRAGERYLTSSDEFLQGVILRNPQIFRIVEERSSLPCLPQSAWGETDFRNKRVLFLLPSGALGDNVGTVLFLQAFAEQSGARAIGVFGARSTADIYLGAGIGTVYTLWIGRGDLKRWDRIIDFGHLEGRSDIDIWPVDMESQLLHVFGLAPAARYGAGPRPLPSDRPLEIGILPLASSPLRTLPVEVCAHLAERLSARGRVTVCLNANQQQGRIYRQAVAPELPADCRIVDVFPKIGDLLDAVAGFDYAVFADSGPAHMSKLSGTPGVAVYSSAPGEVLQGRFTNLDRWTIPFSGPWCTAPCGLAKVRQHRDGRIGCMGSLGAPLADLPTLPGRADPRLVEQLFRDPVPCIAALRDSPSMLGDHVIADLTGRLASPGGRSGDGQR